MIYKKYVVGELETNCYIVTDEKTKKTAVIDPGKATRKLVAALEEIGYENVEYILLTHAHFDHTGGVEAIRKLTGAKVAVFGEDAKMLTDPTINGSMDFGFDFVAPGCADIILRDGEIIEIGETEIKVIFTPGHTSGGCCYYCDGMLFSGDTLFFMGCGRCDMATASYTQMRESLKKLVDTLPPETAVLPGHGQQTTIEYEDRYNPYIIR